MKSLHHTLHERRLWTAYAEHKQLRDNPSLQVKIAHAAHQLLHAETAHVPLLSRYTAAKVGVQMPKDLEVLDAIDVYSKLVDADKTNPRIKPIEIKQNELSIEALRAQIPYIKDGQTKTIIDLGARDATT